MSEIAEINLTKGLVAIIDAGDFSWLSKFRWRASESSSARFYAARTVRIDGVERNFYMHRVITGAPAGFDVDHINGDTLDNRRCNLRPCTRRQNIRNYRSKTGSSQFKGVSWHTAARKWMAYVTANGRRFYLGLFENEMDAARAYDAAAIKLFGEFARPNFEQR